MSTETKRRGPEGVYSYKTKDGRTFWEFRHDLSPDPATGKRRQKVKRGFATQRAARDARAESLGDVRGGTYVETHKTTLGSFLTNEWLPAVEASGKLKSGTLDQYRIYVRARIVPRIGAVALQDLDAATLNRFYADLGKSLAPKSVRNTATMISTALSYAVKHRLVRYNAATDAETPTVKRSEMLYWTPKESKAFLGHVGADRLYALWLLYLTTGMRRGEALGLRWSDVDLDAGRLSIVQTLVVNENEVKKETTKTDGSRRSISISPETLEAVRRWSTRQKAERLAWGPDYEDSGLVFTMENGSRLDPRTVSRTFERLVRAAKVRRIRLHDMRHTYATTALRAGVSAKVVSERLGHKSIAITLDVYAHVIPQHDAEAAAEVERLIIG